LASDDGNYDITIEQRLAADAEINARMRERQARKDQRFLETGDDDSIDEREGAIRLPGQEDRDLGDSDEDDDERKESKEQDVNLEAFDVPLREWIAQERTRREIQNRFKKFLLYFRKRNDLRNELIYIQKIK